jgi:ketosteroid isomerase-like protein
MLTIPLTQSSPSTTFAYLGGVMKRSIAITITAVLLALTAVSQDKTEKAAPKGEASQVEKLIRQAWQDFKDKKKDAYAAALADDFTAVEIDGKGPRDKKVAVKEADGVNVSNFSLTDMKVIPLGSAGAMATYKAKVTGTAGNNPLNQSLAVVEVWRNTGGQWKCVRYQETDWK